MKRFLITNNKDVGASKTTRKRKYDDEYIKFGFTTSENDDSIPFCVVCLSALSNESMVPSKLERHLKMKHQELKDKPKQYFEKLRENLTIQAKKLRKLSTIPDKAQMASYKIAQLLAKRKKSHIDAESIIQPALAIAAEIMIGSEAVEKFRKIPLSHQTISRRIGDMSVDINEQFQQYFLNPKDYFKLWALQIDESTDISNKAQLMAFLRMVREGKIVEDYFFCDNLKTTTTGRDIFDLVNNKHHQCKVLRKDLQLLYLNKILQSKLITA